MEWQPIETAPKDGTWVLGFKERKYVQDQIETWHWVEAEDFVGWEHAAEANDFYEQPTHWMPLPAPPKNN